MKKNEFEKKIETLIKEYEFENNSVVDKIDISVDDSVPFGFTPETQKEPIRYVEISDRKKDINWR